MLAITFTLAAFAAFASGYALRTAREALIAADEATAAVTRAIGRASYRYDAERPDDPV